jgi:hypothetical protein
MLCILICGHGFFVLEGSASEWVVGCYVSRASTSRVLAGLVPLKEAVLCATVKPSNCDAFLRGLLSMMFVRQHCH